MSQDYVSLIDAVDNIPLDFDYADFYRLRLPDDDRTHGFMTAETVEKMPWNEHFVVDHGDLTVSLKPPNDKAQDHETYCNQAFQDLIDKAIEQDKFDVLHGDHSEPYKLMGSKVALNIERFTAPLFGIATRGAHMTAYTRSASGEYKIWVARRSPHLFTYPDKLDTTVAGGVKAYHTPFVTIVEESDEEASLSKDYVREHARAVGVITYMTRSKRSGAVHPDVLYVFDLELPPGMEPSPNDEEVAEFKLMTVEAVKTAMFDGEFKSNCNLVMIDFFLRHGIITSDTEPNYVELQTRLHRQLPIPTSPDTKTRV